MEYSLVVAGLLILSMVIVTLARNKRPTEPLILALQLTAVVIVAAYGVVTHHYILFVVVLAGVANLYRRTRVVQK
jgi:hypothetical protein